MSLVATVRSALAALGPPGSGPHALDVSTGGQRFQAELETIDTLACAFTAFELSADALAAAPIERLKRVAESLAARLTYLLEPIRPIEVDPEQCVVQLRSSPPQKDEHWVSYYELLVRRGGRVSLVRYAKDKGQPRRVVAAQVTREVFLRLVGDFSAAAV